MNRECIPAGSGKTLAYLLPLVQGMREEEKSVCDSLTMRNSPRIIILAPTTELCAQACPVLKRHLTIMTSTQLLGVNTLVSMS